MTKDSPIEKVHFPLIQQPFETVMDALGNKIERQRSPQLEKAPGAKPVFLIFVRAAFNTYKTVRHLCADEPEDSTRKPEYAFSCPALNRTILDCLFTVVFMLEDLPKRFRWYYQSGWRESREKFDRYSEQYGHLAEWKEWLDNSRRLVQSGRDFIGVEERESTDIKYWPNPGKMAKYGIRKNESLPPSREFLSYVTDWFYRDLSAQSHLSFPGLAHNAALLDLPEVRQLWTERHAKKFRSDQMVMSITLCLSLASELEAYLGFQLAEKIKYSWTILGEYFLMSKEVYEFRYKDLLE